MVTLMAFSLKIILQKKSSKVQAYLEKFKMWRRRFSPFEGDDNSEEYRGAGNVFNIKYVLFEILYEIWYCWQISNANLKMMLLMG